VLLDQGDESVRRSHFLVDPVQVLQGLVLQLVGLLTKIELDVPRHIHHLGADLLRLF